MALTYLWLLLVVTTLSECAPVDVALNKQITAETTCGSTGSEFYFGHSQIPVPPQERIQGVCSSVSTHPATAMVDGDADTWWQSTSKARIDVTGNEPDAVITIDLDQSFSTERITLQMGDSKRPTRVCIEKSIDGVNYRPWLYKVTTEANCQNIFGVTKLLVPTNDNSVLCSKYEDDKQSGNETLVFDFQSFPVAAKDWKEARYIRIKFYEMELTLGVSGDLWQHYTIRNIEVLAECICNGLHTDCAKDPISGQYQCVCGGNSAGAYCEECLPYYNQKAFAYGQTCEECNCFNHSNSCVFNQTVADNSLSFNAAGVKDGGGVCLNCQHNTTGINCERCINYFYRPINRQQTQQKVCEPCECVLPGVTTNPGSGLVGDCVMNNDTVMPLGLIPGDCFCKTNVQGSKCNECQDGFFNLTSENPDGCQDCLCNTAGTLFSSAVCTKDAMGQCPCKARVINRRCNECEDEYYGLDAANFDGCSACDCDVGGSVSRVCEKESGNCSCRANVEGRQCDRPTPDHFFPDLHFLSAEFELLGSGAWGRDQFNSGFLGFGYGILENGISLTATLSIPSTLRTSGSKYYLLLRYRAGQQTEVTVDVTRLSQVQSATTNVSRCDSKWCTETVANWTEFSLSRGRQYTVEVKATDMVLLDRVVALPVEFYHTDVLLGDVSAQFHQDCDVVENDMSLGQASEHFCLNQTFSLSSYFYNGAVPCDCHVNGSQSSQCEEFGGQCPCKPGVGGRRCDQCLIEFYNLTAGGCSACDCASDDKICDFVTGQCPCPLNTEGRKCDQCISNHWDWDGANGCQPCNCDSIGSTDLQCNLTTGICDCKPGVNGGKCAACADTYKEFTAAGCVDCDCDIKGRTSPVCDKTTGQCPCKSNAAGLYCDQCKPGSFYLSGEHPTGCLDCICMGITDNCTSAALNYTEVLLTVVQFHNIVQGTSYEIRNINDSLPSISVNARTVRGMPANTATVPPAPPPLYWRNIHELRGDFLASYGGQLQYSVYYTVDTQGGLNVGGLESSENKAVLVPPSGPSITHDLPQVPPNTLTALTVTFHESKWKFRGTDKTLTRPELMTALTNVKWLLLPATWYNTEHNTSIGNVRYTVADDNVEGERALSIEQCQCGEAYSGMSCERCAYGYFRLNASSHEYMGYCTPCVCNGHSDYCNPEDGECKNCTHNTTGHNCDQCDLGYYGDATAGTPDDCKMCPCFDPRVNDPGCDDNSGVVRCTNCKTGYVGDLCDRCADFYYGNPEVLYTGTCKRCDCNGNSFQCDNQTGQCLACSSDTTGFNCERCIDGMYGDATKQECKPCNCDLTGSNDTVCNHMTGQCPCVSGVDGRTCDQCVANQWGFNVTSFVGCIECGCTEAGSESLQCDGDTGACQCKNHTAGDKCDMCAPGLWGLPYRPCEACSCGSIGSIDPNAPCHNVTGQCGCKTGVSGRQCDRCEQFYTGFSFFGCTKCDSCQYSLGQDTVILQQRWGWYWNISNLLGPLVEQDNQLQALTVELNTTLEGLGVSEDTLGRIERDLKNLTNLESGFNSSVVALLNRVSNILQTTQQVRIDTRSELTRLQHLQTEARAAYLETLRIDVTTPGIVNLMMSYNATAHQLLNEANYLYSFLDRSFSAEVAAVAREIGDINNASSWAQVIKGRARQQHEQSTSLDSWSKSLNSELSSVVQSATTVLNSISALNSRMNAVRQTVEEIQHHKQHAESVHAETLQVLNLTENILGTGGQHYQDGMVLFDETAEILADGIPEKEDKPIDSSGHQYMIMFLENRVDRPYDGHLEVFISAARMTSKNITVQIRQVHVPNLANMTYTLIPGEVKMINISNQLQMTGSSLTQQAIEIIGSEELVVYAMNKEEYSTDGFLALPVDSLGTEYYTVSYSPPHTNTEFGIVATEDNTTIHIQISKHFRKAPPARVVFQGQAYENQETMTVVMNKFDSLQIQDTLKGDLTGSWINSNKPIGVFSGNVRTNVGEGTSRDHLVEQLPPVSAWSRNFVVVPIPYRTTGDYLKIVASQPDTWFAVVTNDAPVMSYRIDIAGHWEEVMLPSTSNAYITANKPILLVQIVNSQLRDAGQELADPSMILVPPVEQYDTEYHFSLPKGYASQFTHYFLLAIEEKHKDGLILDGIPLKQVQNISISWQPVPDTEFVGTFFVVTGDQAHMIRHSNPSVNFMGILYGAGDRESYGLPIGYRVRMGVSETGSSKDSILQSSGREFMIMFLENAIERPLYENVQLFVSPDTDVRSVIVEVKQISDSNLGNQTYVIHQGKPLTINISAQLRMEGTRLARKGIQISSSDDVVVHGMNRDQYSADGFLSLPTKSLGKDYYVMSYAPPTKNTEFGIVATQDLTEVSITLPKGRSNIRVEYSGNVFGNGDSIILSMAKFNTFQVQSLNGGDLTGTHIKTSKPVAVFTGNIRTSVGSGNTREHLVEQIPPVWSWGTNFATIPIPGRSAGDIFKIVASQDFTIVTIRNSTSLQTFTIETAGGILQQTLSSSCYCSISSNYPILVAQIVQSPGNNEGSDPAMTLVPPVTNYKSSYRFMAPDLSSYTVYVMVAIKSDARFGLEINGQPLTQSNFLAWRDIPGTNMMGSLFTIPGNQGYTISHESEPFLALMYGAGDKESYAYPAGMNLVGSTASISSSETVEVKGKEFMILFMENRIDQPKTKFLEIFATPGRSSSSSEVTVTISQVHNQSIPVMAVSIPRGQVRKIEIPVELRMKESSLTKQGIFITSNDDVIVYGINKDEYSTDGFLALPINTLGKEYYTVAYSPARYATEIAIAGIEDKTTVSITFTDYNIKVPYQGIVYRHDETLKVELDRYSTLQLQSTQGDLTGTYIVSDKPIAVFSGNIRTNVGEGGSRDHLVEMIPPVKSWGSNFASVPIPNRSTGDVFRVIASHDYTVVTLIHQQGTQSYAIDKAGEYKQFEVPSTVFCYIVSNHPILLVQIVYSQVNFNEAADPSMMLVPAFEQYTNNYHFALPQGVASNYTHYFMLVIDSDKLSGLVLDGKNLLQEKNPTRMSIPGTNKIGAYFRVGGDEAHSLVHPDPEVSFMGLLYGTGDRESYGFPVGMTLVLSLEKPQGFESWSNVSRVLKDLSNTTEFTLVATQQAVQEAQSRIGGLETTAAQIDSEFQSVKDRGAKAVDAIANYERVTQTLNTSLYLAIDANNTIRAANQAIKDITVLDLQGQASESRRLSSELKSQVDGRPDQTQALLNSLSAANSSLLQADERWSTIDNQITQLQNSAAQLHTTASDPSITTQLNQANTTANQAHTTADQILSESPSLQANIATQENLVAVVQTTVNNATAVVGKLTTDLDNFKSKNNTVVTQIQQINAIISDTNTLKQQIEDKMAAIERKLANVKRLASAVQQPVNFPGDRAVVLQNPGYMINNTQGDLFNEFSIEFKVGQRDNGLIFAAYGNSSAGPTRFTLELENRTLVFSFDLGGDLVRMESWATMCQGCWFKAKATRYGNQGHLLVTKLDTGGSHVADGQGTQLHKYLHLNNQVYVAGIPENVQASQGNGKDKFDGCINNIYFDNTKLDLWEFKVSQNLNCCLKPPTAPLPPTTPGVSFDGYGYLQLTPGGFSVATQSHVSLQFRTFDPHGVLIAAAKSGSDTYYALCVQNGYIKLEMGPSNNRQSIRSSRTYNDGEWYKVIVNHNATHAHLYTYSINTTNSRILEIKSINMAASPVNMPELQDGSLFVGGVSGISTPVPKDSFAGCIKELQLNQGSGSSLSPRQLDQGVIASSRVAFDGCFEKVVSGLGFHTSTSYGAVNDPTQLQQLRTVEFELIARNDNGILVYAEDRINTKNLLYVALYGGNLFMQYSYNGVDLSDAVLTPGLWLSDGYLHSVKIDFTNARAKVTVDGKTYSSGSVLSLSYLTFSQGNDYLYVGGAPNTSALHTDLPVKESLINGIRQLKINGRTANMFGGSAVLPVERDTYLSGLPAPPSIPVIPPYTTTTPAPTTPAPTCASIVTPTYISSGKKFGDLSPSYIAFSNSNNNDFTSSFVIVTRFLAISPNGILYYIASGYSNPAQWLTLYMDGGHLVVSMKTDTGNNQTIKSHYTYDDGKWWEVNLLRINDFLALVVTDRRDYINNGVSSQASSTLQLDTKVFIGGVSSQVVGRFPPNIGNLPFHGCISKMEVNLEGQSARQYDISNPNEEVGTGQCLTNVVPGVSLNRTGYIKIGNTFTIGQVFQLSLVFRAGNNTASLASVYQSKTAFFVVQLKQGKVQVVFGDSLDPDNPFAASFMKEITNSICDNQPHTVNVAVSSIGVTITVDSEAPEAFVFPNVFARSSITGSLIVGGMQDPSVPLPDGIMTQGILGCIQSVQVDNQDINLREMTLSGGTYGCPA